jgi:4-hydroxybenzoate polyprenyltransferase
MAMNFGVLFSLPAECVKLGFIVTPLVFIYPTTKRFFRYPQLVLGATFNFGVYIGYAALSAGNVVAWQAVTPFYIGGILWTIVYDSIYAFQDREFDKKLGLNSTAI